MQAGDAGRLQQLEHALTEARARLRACDNGRLLVQSCPDVVVLLQVDGVILEANEAAQRMLGVTREQLLGHCAFDLFSPHVAAGRRAMLAEVANTGAPMHAVDVVDDRVIDHLLVPLRSPQGTMDRIAIYARDITERFEAERRVREKEPRVAGNEKALARDGLPSDLAHEFNNLLTPILGYLRLARQHGADHAVGQQALLDVALDSAESAAALVSGVVEGEKTSAAAAEVNAGTVPVTGGELQAPRPAKTPLNVLAVDDEAGVLQVVEVALLMAGHHVHCFDCATEGWKAFEASPEDFDAAILDQNLGDGTGVELAQRLRARSRKLRIVLISGRPSTGLRRAAEVLDLRLLPKPFSVESLQGALTRD